MPADDDAGGKAHELLASQRERRKLLEDERQHLRQDIVNRASHVGQLCNTVENQGKTVSSIPKDTICPFVRALRQLAKLNRLINECEKDKSLLMGDIMSWRENYRDTNAQDLLDAASTIWPRDKLSKWPSIAFSLRSMVRDAVAQV